MKNYNIPDNIVNMPKVELHVHLEGAFTFECLFNLVQKYGGDADIKSTGDLQKKFVFKDFQQFLETWYWKNQFFRKPEDFEESAYRTIVSLAQQKIIYAEVFFSPWEFVSPDLKLEEIIEATISGIKKGTGSERIRCNLIADIIRNFGAENAMQRLDQVTPYLGNGIIGIGLGGDERNYPAHLFKDVFIEAKNRGFRTTAHAGEAAGPESVWSAIKDLQVERIGHGVRAIEDPALMDYIKEHQVPLEVCITSNIMTKVFPSVKEHPFDRLYKDGYNVTLNSDDPPMFGADLTDELGMLHKKFNYSIDDLSDLTKNAIKVSFADDNEKQRLSRVVNIYAGFINHF